MDRRLVGRRRPVGPILSVREYGAHPVLVKISVGIGSVYRFLK